MTVYLQLTIAIKPWMVRQKLLSVSRRNRILFEIRGMYSSVAITRYCVGLQSSSLSSQLFYLSSMKSHLHALAVSIISRCCYMARRKTKMRTSDDEITIRTPFFPFTNVDKAGHLILKIVPKISLHTLQYQLRYTPFVVR